MRFADFGTLPAVQAAYERTKGRRDVQMVTLSVDEEQDKLVAFMKQKGYTFHVLASKAYVQTVLPQFMLGQFWIVNGSGSVRLQRLPEGAHACSPELTQARVMTVPRTQVNMTSGGCGTCCSGVIRIEAPSSDRSVTHGVREDSPLNRPQREVSLQPMLRSPHPSDSNQTGNFR